MLTILTLNILLMIVYLSHWDWNLYKSRKDIVASINEKTFIAMSPEGDYTTELMETYHKFIEWKINRKKNNRHKRGKEFNKKFENSRKWNNSTLVYFKDWNTLLNCKYFYKK